MSLVPNFSASQIIGQPSIINLTDTSTGSDGAITQRRIFINNAQNQFVTAGVISNVSAYTQWIYANPSIAIDCLPYDMAVTILVQWLDVNNAVLYSKSLLVVFTLYGVTGSFTLSQSIVSSPAILQDQNYWLNRVILRCNIEDGSDAINLMGNISISQSALDRETFMLSKQNLFF